MEENTNNGPFRNVAISTEIGESKALLHSRYTMSKDEGRVLLMCLEKMKRNGECDNGEYWFNVTDYCDIFKITRREAVKDIKAAINNLADRWVHITPGDDEVSMRWIGQKMQNVKEGRYGVVFWPEILPYLHNLSNQLSTPLTWLAAMSSENSQRILRWINEARCSGYTSVTLSLDEIRYGLDIREVKSYSVYNNMKRRIIQPAVDSINTYTSLTVTYTEIKSSRRVDSLHFEWD
ncbi:replication initiation protein [uncultured Pseudoalteromonas sp.]|uniref:replication initiation protein n=1 Tax=uncultured Pseudoalteromonas sp. TaxID=114053 RepID=UPI002592556B|nr:replication initiation protein [uncultured Pseudoalteromonas sp.]